MTPDELDAIRERAALLDLLPGLAGIQRDVGDLLAYANQLERERARSVVRYAGIVADGENHARAELHRNNHVRSTVTVPNACSQRPQHQARAMNERESP